MVATAQAPRRDSPITGFMANWYAKNTRRDLHEFTELARLVAAGLRPGGAVLEVAPGPGYFAIELAKLGDFKITGVDLSADFVRMAAENARCEGVDVELIEGNAAQLPLSNDAFDFVLCRAAFKNFAAPVTALNEMHRVLRPGGRALIIDLRNDATMADIRRHVDRMRLGIFSAALTKLIFKHFLLKRAYSREDFQQMARQSAFGTCTIEADDIGLNVTLRKPSV